MKRQVLYLIAAILTFSAPLAFAQNAMPMPAHPSTSAANMQHHGWQRHDGKMGKMHMMGKHSMSAEVTSVDHDTGVVEVTSHDMSLRLHFPPKSIMNLKAGDMIKVHLSYRKMSDAM